MSSISAELVIRFQNEHLCFSGGLLKETISGTLQTLEDIDLSFLGLNSHFSLHGHVGLLSVIESKSVG